MRAVFFATLAFLFLVVPALAYGQQQLSCPTHEAAMFFTGQTKFENARLYELHKCPFGDTWWAPSVTPAGSSQPNYLQKKDRATFSNPTIWGHVKHPCPACGQETMFIGTEMVDYRLMNLRQCVKRHKSVWEPEY